MKRLRVVHLDAGASWRGGQRQALLLALGLREHGHEPFLIGVPGSPLVARARAEGLAVSAIPMRGDWDLRSARKIRARIRAWGADVVHAHDARSHALGLLALIGTGGTPLVVTRRVAFTPRSVRLKYGERVSRFIAISDAVRDVMVSGGISPTRIDVVRSGIRIPVETVAARDWRAERQWAPDSVICGVVGAMTAEKGIDSLETIAHHLAADAKARARIVFLGGPASGSFEIDGIPSFSAGFVEQIDDAIAGLDVLLHPSRTEGLGTAVLDAMALGVPAIAFAVGGLPEVIEDGTSGLLAPEGDVPAFASATGRLLNDASLRQKLGTAARERAKAFGAEEMTKGTEAVYYRVLAG